MESRSERQRRIVINKIPLIIIMMLVGTTIGCSSGNGDNDSNTAPVITSSDTTSVLENTTSVSTVSATDADGDTLIFSISGGADKSAFTIDSGSGALSFSSAPDYETPTDANTDNAYVVQVTVSDGSTSTTQDITITVTNQLSINAESAAHQPLDGTWIACYDKANTEPDAADRHFFTDTNFVLEEYQFESTDGSCTGQAMVTLHWVASITSLDDFVTTGWLDNTDTSTTPPQNQAQTASLDPNPTVTKLIATMGTTTPSGPAGENKYFYYMDDTAPKWCLYRYAGMDNNADGYPDYVGGYDILCKETGTVTPLASTINSESGAMQLLDGVWSSECRNKGATDYMEQHVIAGGTLKLQNVDYSTSDTTCSGIGVTTVGIEGTVTILANETTLGWHDDTNPTTAPTAQSGSGQLTSTPLVTRLIFDIPSGPYAGSNEYFYYMDDTAPTWCIYRPSGPDGDSDGYADYVANYDPLCKVNTP